MIIIHLIAYSQARGRSERRRCLARKTSSCANVCANVCASAYTLHASAYRRISYIINIADVGHALELVSVFNPNPNPQITLYKSLRGCLGGATPTSAGSASLCWRPAWLAPNLPAHQSGSVRAQRATDPSRPGLRGPPRQRQLLRDIPQGGSAALKGVCGAQLACPPTRLWFKRLPIPKVAGA